MDAAPVLKLSEHVLDFVSSAIESDVVRDVGLTVGFRGDAGADATIGQGVAKQSASYPLSPSSVLALGKASIMRGAPL